MSDARDVYANIKIKVNTSKHGSFVVDQTPVSERWQGTVEGFRNWSLDRVRTGYWTKEGPKGRSFSDARLNFMCSLLEVGLPWEMFANACKDLTFFDKPENLQIDFDTAVGKHDHRDTDCWAIEPVCPNARERSVTPGLRKAVEKRAENKEPAQTSFEIYGPADHAQPIPPMEWLIQSVWANNTHGPLGGAKKTFKSYHALAMSIAIGSGKPYLDEFPVRQGNVVYFIGEGGYKLWCRRLQRMCEAYGIGVSDCGVYAIDVIASVDSAEFRDMIQAASDHYSPVAFIIDPMYAFHPQGIEAQNLYDRGRMLARLSQLIGHDRSLIIADHYRKSGTTLDLDEIGQSGMSQWAHTWILQTHRKPYDQTTGTAHLSIEYGSREGYNIRRNLDLCVGAYDETASDHIGKISWSLNPADPSEPKTANGAEVHSKLSLWQRLTGLLDNPNYTYDENHEFSQAQAVAMLNDIFKFSRSGGYKKFNYCLENDIIVEGSAKKRFRIATTPPLSP